MWKYNLIFKARVLQSTWIPIVSSSVKMSHTASVSVDHDVPIYVATQIPNIVKCIEKTLHNTKIKVINLPTEFSRNVELGQTDLKLLCEAEIMICDNTILAKVLSHVSKLRWAHCTWAGVEPIVSAIQNSKIVPKFTLTRHSGMAFGNLMAEYVICQIISWERHLRYMWQSQLTKTWIHGDRFQTYRPLSNLVVCILGVGNMGCSIARFLHSFGASVLGLSKSAKNISEYPDFERISTELADILPYCDYLCNVLPSTRETFHLLDGDVLHMCAKKPVFLNVGRGNIISEESLLKALRNDWISGAILDVFEEEPLPESSVLWSMPQVVITPHVASISLVEHIVEEFSKNYKLFLAGKELNHVVNWDTGY